MTLTTITQAASDPELQARIVAAVNKEAIANPTFGDTEFGQQVLEGTAPILMRFAYPIAVDNEAAYEYAVSVDPPNEHPGSDPGVITDAAISAAVQAHWPEDPA